MPAKMPPTQFRFVTQEEADDELMDAVQTADIHHRLQHDAPPEVLCVKHPCFPHVRILFVRHLYPVFPELVWRNDDGYAVQR